MGRADHVLSFHLQADTIFGKGQAVRHERFRLRDRGQYAITSATSVLITALLQSESAPTRVLGVYFCAVTAVMFCHGRTERSIRSTGPSMITIMDAT